MFIRFVKYKEFSRIFVLVFWCRGFCVYGGVWFKIVSVCGYSFYGGGIRGVCIGF